MRAIASPPPIREPIDPSGPAVDEAEAEAVEVTPAGGAILLRLARAIVVAAASGRIHALDRLLPPDPPLELVKPAAAFVTLHEGGALRGCMGSLDPVQPLWQAVVAAAVGAAVEDPRFEPVAACELSSLSIDVSVLGPAVPLRDPATFRAGVHGVIVERHGRRGLLLPEVATDQHWGLRDMLEGTCRKAGLPVDAWRDPGTRVLAFRTVRFSESDPGA